MIDENIRALLDALRETQKMRDAYKASAEMWREKAEDLGIELGKVKAGREILRDSVNGSEATR